MLEYFLLDWREFGLPVYPVAVLSHRDFNSQSRSPLRLTFRKEELLNFHFAIVDLGRMEARKYVQMQNIAAMALSTRMKLAAYEKWEFALDFLRNRHLAECTTSELETISSFFFAYQGFDEEDALKLRRKLSMIEDMDIPKAVLERNPIFIFGRDKGRNEGLLQGESNLVLRLLARQIGSIPSEQEKTVRNLPLEEIEALGEALFDFRSGEDLSRWLDTHR